MKTANQSNVNTAKNIMDTINPLNAISTMNNTFSSPESTGGQRALSLMQCIMALLG